jgi:putative ABC transport system permease protein
MRGGVPLAWRNLAHDKRRLAVSLTGIGFAVLLMFVELGFWNAMLDAAVELIRQCKGDLAIVSKATYTLAIRETFSTKRLAQAHGVPGVKAAFPLYFESTQSLWRDTDNRDYNKPRTHPIRVIAFDPSYDAFKNPEIGAQKHLLRRNRLGQRHAVLLDRRSKEDYGTRDAPMERELSRKRIEVVGTFALGADFTTDGNLVMSAEDFARFFPNPLAPGETLHLAHLGLVQLADGADALQVQKTLRSLLPDDVSVLTMDELIRKERRFWQNATPIGFIFTFGLVIGVIVGMVICSQVLQSDVAAHLKEYATLKAMGYRGAYLIWVVLQEGLWLGVLGFLPAFVACLFLYGWLAELTELPLYLTAPRVAVVFGLTCFMCVVAGILAVRKVQQSDPAEVF